MKVILWLIVMVMVGGISYFIGKSNTHPSQRNTAESATELDVLKKQKLFCEFYLNEAGHYIKQFVYNQNTPHQELYQKYSHEFLELSPLVIKSICPREVTTNIGNDYIFYGARMIPVRQLAGPPNYYATSYLGHAQYTHAGKYFDSYTLGAELGSLAGEVVRLEKAAGILDWYFANSQLEKLQRIGDNGYHTPFSYNAADMNGDGIDDFFIGDLLILSANPSSGQFVFNKSKVIKGFDENIFIAGQQQNYILGLKDKSLVLATLNEDKITAQKVFNDFLQPREVIPFTILPTPANLLPGKLAFLYKFQDKLSLYSIDESSLALVLELQIHGLDLGEYLVGGFGQFLSSSPIDLWISQSASAQHQQKIGRAFLLSGEKIRQLAKSSSNFHWAEVAALTVEGSRQYTDYDGIGTTLSLFAGDIDGDGKSDFSFSGHRHLNEAGVLFILTGKSIANFPLGSTISVGEKDIIKIKGKPLSQLAPPFLHDDSYDFDGDGHTDIVVTADNDFCSGVNAGALYILSGEKIASQWQNAR